MSIAPKQGRSKTKTVFMAKRQRRQQMRETKVSEIMGMIEDHADDERVMAVRALNGKMGFFNWYRSDLVRETLREVPDDEN